MNAEYTIVCRKRLNSARSCMPEYAIERRNTQSHAGIHGRMPEYTVLCRNTQLYAGVHNCMPEYTVVCRNTELYADNAQSYAGIHTLIFLRGPFWVYRTTFGSADAKQLFRRRKFASAEPKVLLQTQSGFLQTQKRLCRPKSCSAENANFLQQTRFLSFFNPKKNKLS